MGVVSDESGKSSKTVKLPEPWAKPGDSREAHAVWVSAATRHEIVGVWRPGRGDRAGIVVRLADGYEVSFETITEASRPDRFINAFTGIDGVVMPSYGIPAVRELVGALVRMAEIDKDRDEREDFRAIGADYLRGCLGTGSVVMTLATEASVYYAGRRYQALVSKLRGDAGEPWPEVMYATDEQALFVSRRLFAAYARRASRTSFSPTFQMPRCGWEDVDLQPYPPKTVKGPRLKLRLWRIAEGWEGVSVEHPETGRDGQTHGDAPRDAETHGAAPTPTRARVGAVLRSSTRLHVSEDGSRGPEFFVALRGDPPTLDDGLAR